MPAHAPLLPPRDDGDHGARETPAAGTWALKARQHFRNHVEGEIRTAQADLDVSTERRGSPHGLVCQKNSATYKVARRSGGMNSVTSDQRTASVRAKKRRP
jgi:hypothetical protein